MCSADMVLAVLLLGLVLRHLLVLNAIYRSYRFLNQDIAKYKEVDSMAHSRPFFYIVLPVLREAGIIRQTVAHFEALLKGHQGRIVVVTTAREDLERERYTNSEDTIFIVKELAKAERCIHLHYPNPHGVKADQLNFAVDYLASSIANGAAVSRSFLVCYDADSRPPFDSLACFENSIVRYPDVDVFHQSSRFELRQIEARGKVAVASWVQRVIADSGALRANRFVLACEIPRLLNSSSISGALKRRVSSYVYSHVTGHGLCVRLSLLERLPFPQRSPLEDMHYSFILRSRNEEILPISSLDCAEIPASLHAQVEQAARWFFGPGRFFSYLRHPETTIGLRAYLLCVSAFVNCIEWLSCSIMPMVLVLLVWHVSIFIRALAAAFIIIYFLQLIATDLYIDSTVRPLDRVGRFLAYPIGCTLFGIGGIIGASRLLRGRSVIDKTER